IEQGKGRCSAGIVLIIEYPAHIAYATSDEEPLQPANIQCAEVIVEPARGRQVGYADGHVTYNKTIGAFCYLDVVISERANQIHSPVNFRSCFQFRAPGAYLACLRQ